MIFEKVKPKIPFAHFNIRVLALLDVVSNSTKHL
jgi:hypothetical protein